MPTQLCASEDGIPRICFWARNGSAAWHAVLTGRIKDRRSPRHSNSATTIENDHLKLVIDPVSGDFTSLVHKPTGREIVAQGGQVNRLQLFEDRPKQWDAWEIDLTRDKWEVDKAKSVDRRGWAGPRPSSG